MMKAFIFMCIICYALGVPVVGKLAAPVPPPITQHFAASYTLGDPAGGQMYQGVMIVDFKYGGAVFLVEKSDPMFSPTRIIVHPIPESGNVSVFIYNKHKGMCWNAGTWPLEYITQFPLAIPEGSQYLGTEVVDNHLCQIWSFEGAGLSGKVTIWVNEKNFLPARIDFESFGSTLRLQLTDPIIGPFTPSTYRVPEVDCSHEASFDEIMNVVFLPIPFMAK